MKSGVDSFGRNGIRDTGVGYRSLTAEVGFKLLI